MKWFFGAGVLLLAALVLESGLLAYAMYVLFAVMVLSRVLARSWTNNLSANRTCKITTAEIGDTVRVGLNIRNAGALPVPWVILEDLLPRQALDQRPPRLRITGKRIQIRMLSPRQEADAGYKIECNMRGYYQIGPMVMESGDLFGLHRRYRVDAEPHYLLVYPKVVPLEGYDLASRRPIGDIRLSHRLYEDPTRIAGVRPYEAGDPMNRVHWGATARTGLLHSKIYDPSSLAGATILLDFHKAGYPKRGEPDRSELAVTTAVSLANAVFLMGQQVGMVSNGRDAADRIRQEGWQGDYRTRTAARQKAAMQEQSERLRPLIVETRRGAEQFHRIRETLARLELTDGLTAPELIVEVSSRLPRDATVIAVLPAVPVETALILGSLRRQGFAVSAVLIALDGEQLEKAYGRLMAEGVRDVRHLRQEAGLPHLCQQQVSRGAAYSLQVEL
jgi:uncharacterized repeat protein (TIGR01451 family)